MTRPTYTLLAAQARARGGAAFARGVCTHAPHLGALFALALGLLAWPYTVDDAFIGARYARNIVRGAGYAMNAGELSDGVTGPLWLLPEVAALRLGGDPIAAAKTLGLLCNAAAVWLVLRALQLRSGGRTAAVAALPLLALSPSLATWAVAGLETGAATLLLVIAALAALRRPRLAALRLGAASGALAWLRPELALSCAVLLGYAGLRDARSGLRAFMLALGAALALLAFRLWMFGDALPLSVRAKPGSLAHGVAYAALALLLATSLFGAVLAGFGAQRGREGDRALGWVLLAHLLAVVLAGGDWMPGYRLFVPVLPLYALLAAIGVARARRRMRATALVLLGLACVVPALDLATRLPDLRRDAETRARTQALARWLRAHATKLALVDVGLLGYASDLEIVDLAGLTDARIAHMPGGHLSKHVDPRYLLARDPDAIVVHSATPPRVSEDRRLLACSGFEVEMRVLALPFVAARYRVARVAHIADNYDYVVLLRDGDPAAAYGTPR